MKNKIYNDIKLFFRNLKKLFVKREYFLSLDYSKCGDYACKQFGYKHRNGKIHIIKTEWIIK